MDPCREASRRISCVKWPSIWARVETLSVTHPGHLRVGSRDVSLRSALVHNKIRRRRPTPATLVIYSDPSAAADDKRTANNPGEAQSAEPSPPQMDQSTYSPPTMRELQLVMEQHLQKQEQLEAGPGNGSDPFGPTVEQHCPSAAQWANRNGPEPNGNEAYVSSLCTPEDSSNSTITKGEVMTSEGQQENLSSPSSISR
ncbi:protein phosphatase 1 regulatory subunit 1C isoform X2 [Scleropages formosus]|uniref:protein phosphatase 1 regulatory subunit 1C isoform X2 n=1 Tax=Scleropages formosus TaxID=113540 RepID=UPI00087813E3|nr:protein phosphatase 1 regulatory subunit 1C isoform X2 [Scleropages formosus]